jgi:hypothetical protein
MQRFAGRALVAGVTLVAPVAAVMILLDGSSDPAAAAPATPYATSTAVALRINHIASLGITGYSGTWGTAKTGSAGGSDQSDFSDPDGVQNYVSVATNNSQTSGINAPIVYDARTDLNTLFTGPSLIAGGPKIISLATLQNYVRCAPPAQAHASSFTVAATAFGKMLTPGVPLTVSVSGSDLGLAKVKNGTVTVTLDNIKETTGGLVAAARTVITMKGDLTTTDGGTYNGELATMVLGDVRVNCGAEVAPTESPSESPSESPTETTSPTASPSPTVSPTPTTSVQIATPTPTVPSTPTVSLSPTASPSPAISPSRIVSPAAAVSPSPASSPSPLPVTGFDLEVLGGSAGLLAAIGAALLTGTRR